jgi:ketosteroid isomerase-like protein
MSQENVELVKRLQPDGLDLVQVFSRSLTELVSEDDAELFIDGFEVRVVLDELGNVARRGPEGLTAMWRDWLSPWDSFRLDVEEFIDAGDAVVVFARVLSRTKHDGVLMEHSPAAIWWILEGKVAAIHFFLDRAAALEAVGLPGQDAYADS